MWLCSCVCFDSRRSFACRGRRKDSPSSTCTSRPLLNGRASAQTSPEQRSQGDCLHHHSQLHLSKIYSLPCCSASSSYITVQDGGHPHPSVLCAFQPNSKPPCNICRRSNRGLSETKLRSSLVTHSQSTSALCPPQTPESSKRGVSHDPDPTNIPATPSCNPAGDANQAGGSLRAHLRPHHHRHCSRGPDSRLLFPTGAPDLQPEPLW